MKGKKKGAEGTETAPLKDEDAIKQMLSQWLIMSLLSIYNQLSLFLC